ncbi:uncharacterized protein J3D65DRAFT_454775 [Phyllosticta citribraziliensis]|uniref:Uncharacterized protein n=1 Tax=Phyllosticta citribraziliensis TaxID=989973 RepID=A0ABR1LEW5_9PEZI
MHLDANQVSAKCVSQSVSQTDPCIKQAFYPNIASNLNLASRGNLEFFFAFCSPTCLPACLPTHLLRRVYCTVYLAVPPLSSPVEVPRRATDTHSLAPVALATAVRYVTVLQPESQLASGRPHCLDHGRPPSTQPHDVGWVGHLQTILYDGHAGDFFDPAINHQPTSNGHHRSASCATHTVRPAPHAPRATINATYLCAVCLPRRRLDAQDATDLLACLRASATAGAGAGAAQAGGGAVAVQRYDDGPTPQRDARQRCGRDGGYLVLSRLVLLGKKL